MANTSLDQTGLLTIDEEITRRTLDAPGIAQPEIVRDLQTMFAPSTVRQRIDLLAARGVIRTERRDGRIYIYPVEIPA